MPVQSSSTVLTPTFWMIQGGITKNWFGLGNTSFYGEYGRAKDYIQSGPANSAIAAFQTRCNGLEDANSDVNFYGIGVVQQIDAAAMELYLGWRRFESTVTGAGNVGRTLASKMVRAISTSSHGGARIRF